MEAAEVELDIVAAAPTAAGEARRALADRGLVEDEQEPTLMLLVSELVSNSVRHAGLTEHEEIHLRARARRRLRATSRSATRGRAGRRPAIRRDPSLDALEPGGLGLSSSTPWPTAGESGATGDETCVWFELGCG